MELFKTPHIPFLKYKYWALALTGTIVLAGVVNWTMFKGLKYGVDFGEGTLLRVKFSQPTDVGSIRKLLKDIGLGNSVIQETGKTGEKGRQEFQIRAMESSNMKSGDQEQLEAHAILADKIIAAIQGEDRTANEAKGLKDLNTIDEKGLASLLEPAFPGTSAESAHAVVTYRNAKGVVTGFSEIDGLNLKGEVVSYIKQKTYIGRIGILSRETVGPQVGKDLRKRALQAVIWSLIGMLVYVALRFKIEYGVAAILTLAQDVLVTLAIYSFTNREISLQIIAGLLTIIGYSINDTIVIFDRIRENQKLMRKAAFEDIMDLSINQCLGRTVITSGTVFLTVLALFLFGGEVINDFAFLFLIGTIEGVYSTLSASCPFVYFWRKWFPVKTGRR